MAGNNNQGDKSTMIRTKTEYPVRWILDGLQGSMLIKSIDFSRALFGQRIALKILKIALDWNEKRVGRMFVDFMYEIDEINLKLTGRHEGDKAIIEFEKLNK
jgi:hypothetical protein